MAIVVIGRGIDLSLIAVARRAAGPGAADGAGRPLAAGRAARRRCCSTLAFGLVNGWLIAYAEVPSLFTTLASGLFLAGLGQAALFQLDVVQWSPQLDGFQWLGQRHAARRADADHHVRASSRCVVVVLPAAHALGHLHLRHRRQPVRRAHHRHPDAAGDRAAIRAGGADRLLRRHGAGGLGQQHADAHLQLDADLRRDPGRRARRHRPVRRPRRRRSTSSSARC